MKIKITLSVELDATEWANTYGLETEGEVIDDAEYLLGAIAVEAINNHGMAKAEAK